RNRPDGSNRSDRGDAAVRMPVPQLNAPRLKWRFHTASVESGLWWIGPAYSLCRLHDGDDSCDIAHLLA
ncbi:hypothetical protein U1839_24240, partial [Sphingomonas sp. RT2P30]|uniref:hypothetical protein n=1 Tax=Parasphingomonas halimpatiens TaxID=3096162 RepID=UPI002FC7B0F0